MADSDRPDEADETHDNHGFRLASHHVGSKHSGVWWYEENDGIHVAVEPAPITKQFVIRWREILAAARRGGKL